MNIKYVIARNRGKRPTLQHIVSTKRGKTVCGIEMVGWTRYYSTEPIQPMLCQRCPKRLADGVPTKRRLRAV